MHVAEALLDAPATVSIFALLDDDDLPPPSFPTAHRAHQRGLGRSTTSTSADAASPSSLVLLQSVPKSWHGQNKVSRQEKKQLW